MYDAAFCLSKTLTMSAQNGHLQHDVFSLTLKVRDYECDMADGVNNAVYLNYLEHARHEYLKELGIDFAEYARQKIGLVVLRIEADFKTSLVSGDEFVVRTRLERLTRIRFQFCQDIYRLPDERLVLSANVIGTAVNARGRPEVPKEIEAILGAVTAGTETA